MDLKTYRIVLISWLWLTISLVRLSAQNLPSPGASTGEWIVREVTPRFKSEMPIKKPAPGYQDKIVLKLESPIDPRTRQLASFFDVEKGFAYDFENGILTDTQTGKVYQFYKKGEKPKLYPPHSDASTRLLTK